MKTFFKPRPVAVMLLSAFTGLASQAIAEETSATATNDRASDSGISASVYFTDEFGNRRNPTLEERAALSAQFQKDLARIAGKNRGNPNVKQYDNGAVSATVALSKMQFLVVHENPDGSRTFSHAPLDEDGNVALPEASTWPEE